MIPLMRRREEENMVYMLCADGLEECEALVTLDMLRRADIDVKTVSLSEKLIKGAHGINFEADVMNDAITTADIENSECLILPGGGVGTKTLSKRDDVAEYVKAADKCGAVVAAICAAPSVLGIHGLLIGKRATCYPGFEKYLDGCEYTGESVTVCGNIITAKGMGCAVEFSAALIEALKGKPTADRILEEIMYGGV